MMSEVPSDLYHEILLRVPAESLLRCRAVCRDWCCIINDPSFIKSHTLSHQSSKTAILIKDCHRGPQYYLPLHSLNLTYANHDHDYAQEAVDLNTVNDSIRYFPTLASVSCHGLVLLYDFSSTDNWTIWNPLTRDMVRVFHPDSHYDNVGVGIGYDYASDDYKVVKIEYDKHEQVLKTRVYSLKSRTWKVIQDCPSGSISWCDNGAYLDGAIYWTNNESMIYVLDLATEEYRLLPRPPSLRPQQLVRVHYSIVYALDGCLIFSDHYIIDSEKVDWFKGCFHVWRMKLDDDGIWSWIKLSSLVGEEGSNEFGRYSRVVSYSKERGEFIVHNGSNLYWFETHENWKMKKKVSIGSLGHYLFCQDFGGSLVRLPSEVES